MIASLIALGLAAATAPAAAPPAEKSQAQADPLLVVNPDGSWTITRAIEEPEPELAGAAETLVEHPDFDAWPYTSDAQRDEELEQQAEDAFEDAIEAARRDEVPN